MVSLYDPIQKMPRQCSGTVGGPWMTRRCNGIARAGSNYCASCRSEAHPSPLPTGVGVTPIASASAPLPLPRLFEEAS
jgi:hypothetical protein